MSTVLVLVVVTLLKLAASVHFAVAPKPKGDGAFLFLFGIASVGDLGRFWVVPLKLLLVTPAAFLAGAVALWVERSKRARSEQQL